MGSSAQGTGYIYLEWTAFFLSFALWLVFCVYFAHTLKPALDFTYEKLYLEGVVWYYLSAAPAVAGVILELMRNRVDLYEPAERPEEVIEMSSSKCQEGQIISLVSQQRFNRVKVQPVFSLWLRILLHQWR